MITDGSLECELMKLLDWKAERFKIFYFKAWRHGGRGHKSNHGQLELSDMAKSHYSRNNPSSTVRIRPGA